VLSKVNDERQIMFFYDINCTFEPWLKKNFPEHAAKVDGFAIPILHSYGHVQSCQLKYNPRGVDGFLLSDGEGCERMWSTLSSIVTIVRECREPLFIDLLSMHMKHIRRTKVEEMGNRLISLISTIKKRHADYQLSADKLVADNPLIHDEWVGAIGSLTSPTTDESTPDADARISKLTAIFTAASAFMDEEGYLYGTKHLGTDQASASGKSKFAKSRSLLPTLHSFTNIHNRKRSL
jgi:hypothetical protein